MGESENQTFLRASPAFRPENVVWSASGPKGRTSKAQHKRGGRRPTRAVLGGSAASASAS